MTTNIHDAGSGRYVGGETPTRDDHLATKGYVDAHSGGAPVDVTDGSTTVTGITELDFTSGATVTDAGGGVAQVAVSGGSSTLQLVGPSSVAFNTAGFMSPSDNGVATVAVPSGSVLLRAFAVTTAEFVDADVGDELVLTLLVAANGSGPTVAYYLGNGFVGPYAAVANAEPALAVSNAKVRDSSAVALNDCHVFAAYYPNATPPSAGSIAVYALISTA